MPISFAVARDDARAPGVLVVALRRRTKELPPRLAALTGRALRDQVAHAHRSRRFTAEKGTTHFVSGAPGRTPEAVLLVGLGDDADAASRWLHAGAAAVRALDACGVRTASWWIDAPDEADAEVAARRAAWAARGAAAAAYRFGVKRSPVTAAAPRRIVFVTAHRAAVREAARRAAVVNEAADTVRDLVNLPGNRLRPSQLAARVREMAREAGVSARVLGPRQVQAQKLGALAAVGAGSDDGPRLVILHANRGAGPRVGLVGKGVTFDTGGISLKSWEKMSEMKGDMAGAAVVAAVTCAAARLELPVEIVAVIPAVENMPDGGAYRPGDIVETFTGETVEVISTDAEGRLVLADAIAWLRDRHEPDVIVDVATLTGAVMIALGTHIAGVMGNSPTQTRRMIEASRRAAEPAWELPLDETFREAVRGRVSDLRNYAGRYGSASLAAALLAHFAGRTPWVHVDIAGTFWNDGSGMPWHPEGATGYGVELMLEYLASVAADR